MAKKNLTLTLKISDIRSKLSPEGQRWLDAMDRGELDCTEVILNNVGADNFVENWPRYKADLDHVRNF